MEAFNNLKDPMVWKHPPKSIKHLRLSTGLIRSVLDTCQIEFKNIKNLY